ncbi:MAG: hypothetical protein JW967_01660 [Dehalococcoidales bacterium]|nr:hypothetical protein [Dehalococcoidales bacterium]
MPEPRKCLFCDAIAPRNIPTAAMITGPGKNGWYSNALIVPGTGGIYARFFLCPEHRKQTEQAWAWARRQPMPVIEVDN